MEIRERDIYNKRKIAFVAFTVLDFVEVAISAPKINTYQGAVSDLAHFLVSY